MVDGAEYEGSELGLSEVQVDGGDKQKPSFRRQRSDLPESSEPQRSFGSPRKAKTYSSFVILKSRQGQVEFKSV